ncbi:high-potential iron-sulfur protein [Paraburkholderia fungorum]|uniref:High-potential iron-sulfur protein n=1 Tax=Paraburkholderia fungorum TaxID=134537 RepID=A0AAP5UVC6_9BURK|nr:high-potential iron-sulfur protein [Paraburkholderia fungorum]MDT8840163.1 high-potential iron-sulfur protein [Paraburkholderia fungorum]
MKSSRRSFMISLVGVASSFVLTHEACADAAPVLESDTNAQALGYRTDAGKVDHAKYPKFQAGQACANCQFFQGKAGDATAPCTIFAGKLVNAKGWCSAYVKKA